MAELATETENAREYSDERAAIGEYDGELSRPQAEAQAARRVFEYRLSDDPGTSLLLLAAPGDELPDAERALALRFGAERVLDVRRYRVTGNSTGRS
jgi:hypothetical protein